MASQDFFSRYWLFGVIALLVVLNALWIFRLFGAPQMPAGEGRPAPDLSLPRLGDDGRPGAALSLEELRGKVVVLDFWASWCAPCAQSLPDMAAFDQRMRGRGVATLGILTDDEDLRGAARMARELGVRYPVLVDADHSVGDRYGISSLPTLMIVDRQGVIRTTEVGPRPPRMLARLVEPLLQP